MLLVSLCTAITMRGQRNDKSRINEVKKDASYLYGEATLLTRHDAIRLACDLLKNEVKKWSEENNIHYNEFPEVILSQLADTIAMNRSNKTRAFVYVRKSELPSVFSGKSVTVTKKPETVSPQPPQKPISAIVVAPQPQQPVNTSSSIIVAQPQQPATPYMEQVTEEVPDNLSYNTNPVVEKIKTIDSFYDLKSVMEPLHEQGVIKNYGKYSTMKDPIGSYLVIYDSNGYIKALLGKGTEERLNLKTLQPDSEKNYPGCGAIWFQLSDNNN